MHLAEEVHHRADVEELHTQRTSRRSTISSPTAVSSRSDTRRAAALTDVLGSMGRQNISSLLVHGADVLGEIGPTQPRRAGDLARRGRRRVTARHEVEQAHQRTGASVRPRLPTTHAPRALAGASWPTPRSAATLSGRQECGWPRHRGEHLPASCLDVERGLGVGHALPHQAGVAPRRALLGAARPSNHGEVPALHRGRPCLGNQLLEAGHADRPAQEPAPGFIGRGSSPELIGWALRLGCLARPQGSRGRCPTTECEPGAGVCTGTVVTSPLVVWW